jgi:pyruvate dehydrogenase E1 component
VLAYGYPSVKAYDPAFAYEIHDGITRMYCDGEDLDLLPDGHERDLHAAADAGRSGGARGHPAGMYRFSPQRLKGAKAKEAKAHLLGSGAILNEAIKAQEVLEEQYGVAADVWSVTSYKELYRDAVEASAATCWTPGPPRTGPGSRPACWRRSDGVFVAASDYMKVMPAVVARWFPRPPAPAWAPTVSAAATTAPSCATSSRLTARYIALAALHELVEDGDLR